jgi:hypothetical protein
VWPANRHLRHEAKLLGGGQQVLALSGPVGGQDGVAAGDQPLAGVVIAGDLGYH